MSANIKVHQLFSEIAGICRLNGLKPDVHYDILRAIMRAKRNKVSGKDDASKLYAHQKEWMAWLLEPKLVSDWFTKKQILEFYDIIHAIRYDDYVPPKEEAYEPEPEPEPDMDEQPAAPAPTPMSKPKPKSKPKPQAYARRIGKKKMVLRAKFNINDLISGIVFLRIL